MTSNNNHTNGYYKNSKNKQDTEYQWPEPVLYIIHYTIIHPRKE